MSATQDILRFARPDGSPMTDEQKRAAWLKAAREGWRHGGEYRSGNIDCVIIWRDDETAEATGGTAC